MNSERWGRIEELFFQAVEVDPAKRGEWLDEKCAGDPELRTEVNRLLNSDQSASPALSDAVGASVRSFDAGGALPFERIGPYEILAELGRGGMGVVYRARRDDDVFRKDVAIKVVKRGMDTDQILTRFLHERRILARLEHPSIARILDGGSTESGLPYLVMEYVDGLPLTDYCAQHQLTLRQRLELFCRVCGAIEYAHQHLVVHRDLKPSNILVDGEGTPKLLDFGIAKLLAAEDGDVSTLTSEGTRLLTPQYASPEQVAGEPITTASDIYSLGTVLYELLTGSQAHRITANTPVALLQAVCKDDVMPASKAARLAKNPPVAANELAGDLDNILLTALQKEREERYGSVHLLAEDLRRFLSDMPVLARPQTLRYRTAKFLRRNRGLVIAGTLAAASLVGGTGFSMYQARRAERRFNEVRTLANAVLFDIHDQIETLPGTTRVRELMVSTVLRYLNNLAKESSGDPSLQWELATAYQKIGDVQGYGVRPNLGRIADAMESHRKALAIAEQLAAHSDEPRVQRLLAMAHHRVGYLTESSQMPEGGVSHYNQAIAILERLNRNSPGDPDDSPLLITTYGHRGDSELARGNPAAAGASWQKSLEVAERWAARDPGDAAKNALGNAHRRVSRAAQLNGELEKAADQARQAIAVHEPLAAAQPANIARQRELLNSYERLSFVAGDCDVLCLGDMATAITYNKKVVAIAADLVDSDPNNRMAESDLVIAERSACAFVPDNDPAEVIRVCQTPLDLMVQRNRNMIEVQPAVALRMGPAYLRLGRRAEAVKAMETAIPMIEDATRKWPWRTDMRRLLINLHDVYGGMLQDIGDAAKSLSHHRAAVGMAEELQKAHANDLALQMILANRYQSMGRYWEKVDRAQAAEWYRKELDIWAKWPGAVSGRLDRARKEEAERNVARCEGR